MEQEPDTATLHADIRAWVWALLDAEVHADTIREVVEKAISDWRNE